MARSTPASTSLIKGSSSFPLAVGDMPSEVLTSKGS